MIKAIIFDMDGTIVGTEKLAEIISKRVFLQETGIELTDDDCALLVGYPWKERLLWLSQKKGVARDKAEQIYEKIIPAYNLSLDDDLPIMPGVISTIKNIAKNYLLGIYSGSDRYLIEKIVKSLGIDSFFPVIVSAEDVQSGKPDPEGFLKAAKLLSVKPEECLVFEDSEVGIAAAKTAGMKCIALKHFNDIIQNQEKADLIINTFDDFLEKDIEKLF